MSLNKCKFCNGATWEVPAQQGRRPCEVCREREREERIAWLVRFAYDREEVSIGYVAEVLRVKVEEARELMEVPLDENGNLPEAPKEAP
jgi:hypothetical protein